MTFRPDKTIVPIFGLATSGSGPKFLGTASFVGSPPLLLTANHVISGWEGGLGIAVFPDFDHFYNAAVVRQSREYDLAFLNVTSYSPPAALMPSSQSEMAMNELLTTFEYGMTNQLGERIVVSPATRLGNITRVLNMEMYGKGGDEMLELSFPALMGASGAPVVSNDGQFKLKGIIVANTSHHLLPAQIEKIFDKHGQVEEETHYMLPQALAVNVKHIRTMLALIQDS